MKNHSVPLAGVIGQPISHSKSPILFSHWLNRYAISGHYIPMDVDSGDLARVLAILPRIGFRGVNVTIPHKEAVLEIADVISDQAASIGAANTLTFKSDGKINADNTDSYGFMENLKQSAKDWVPDGGPALVLGAGGAARAVVSAILHENVDSVFIANRTRTRAEGLKLHFGQKITVIDWDQIPLHLENLNLLVNTTSLGMSGKENHKLSLRTLDNRTLVTDIVYTPLHTSFLQAAEAAGCRTVDGLGMLLHQAAPGFERWFGKRPQIDDALRQKLSA